MTITADMHSEMNLLLQFPTDSLMTGIKIHHDAAPETIAAAQRLFDKGFTDAHDGGYLTDAGIELVEHLQVVHSALK
ncbi:MAG: TIGR02647 family protein [Reinekea sp.]|nr:TIGR02647 family protein [Reinekea sp.]